jgi:hypothetical protein
LDHRLAWQIVLKDREKGEAELRAKKSLNCEKKKNYKFDIVAVSCSGISSEKYVSTRFSFSFFSCLSSCLPASAQQVRVVRHPERGGKGRKEGRKSLFFFVGLIPLNAPMADHRICFHQTSAILIRALCVRQEGRADGGRMRWMFLLYISPHHLQLT